MTHRVLSFGLFTLAWLGGACAERSAPPPVVRPGIEVLLLDSLHLVAERRVGLLTNQTGVDRAGVSDVERLIDAGIDVVAIFSPEHGYRGVLDQEEIGHTIDPATGKTIYSLYGIVLAPTADMLRGIDVMLIDLQDIGGRPYTHITTVLRTLESVRGSDIGVVLLDRPNPIGGQMMQGPVLDTAVSSNIGMLPIPMRHGMTLGELCPGPEALPEGADPAMTVAEVVVNAESALLAGAGDATLLFWKDVIDYINNAQAPGAGGCI